MRKNIKKFAGIVLCIGMFTGCAQTPDSSLVKPKGSKAVDAYTEADDVSGSKGEASESKNDDGSESKTTIRNLIDAPQNYKSHVEDDSAKLVVNTDASVEIPEVEKISAISVTAAEVTQELLDRITNAFFSEAKLYTMDSYYVKTKDEIKKTLDELKEDVANGNLDPYNYGTDDDGNYVYDIYEDIETWEQEYETAPEKKTLTEAKPVAGNYFSCIAQMHNTIIKHLTLAPIPCQSRSRKQQTRAGTKYRRMQCGVITDILKRKKNPQKNLSGCPWMKQKNL